jgi:hypothetical protein
MLWLERFLKIQLFHLGLSIREGSVTSFLQTGL